MTPPSLFTPLELGAITLAHRVVMPPLTRMRARRPGNEPSALAPAYYGQRATEGGLLIAEATQVAPVGQGYPATPGIHTSEQVSGWRQVVDAVHAKGGFIFLQLWHVGRISHSSHQPSDAAPVAPSAIKPAGKAMTANFTSAPFETPRALELAEIATLVDDYARATRFAEQAGFDGVEIHAANGYLIDQFLEDRANHREDAYGGSIANRTRLLTEVVDAAIVVVGADRVGVRLSPFGTINDIGDSSPEALFGHAIRALDDRGIAYLHLIEARAGAGFKEFNDPDIPLASATFRSCFSGPVIASGGYDQTSATHAISTGTANAVAFGRAFISNPDLVERLRSGIPLNAHHRPTFYGGDAAGYTDYPTMDALPATTASSL